MRSQPLPEAAFDDYNVATLWGPTHRYGPAPRHRRRLIRKMVSPLTFDDVLDAGCAQPFLLQELIGHFAVQGFGCDISDQVMEASRTAIPECKFETIDLAYQTWPEGRQFDLVVCSETLEHIDEWEKALDNLIEMSRRYLLITVPGGVIRKVDRAVGHYRHFELGSLTAQVERRGLKVLEARLWGFPMHSLYRWAFDKLDSDAVFDAFGSGQDYTRSQRLVSNALYGAFFLNDFFRSGNQLLVLAEKPASQT